MAENGILIDVGFKADIQDFIKNIEKEFKKIDYENVIGLSEAFSNQEKEIKAKLEDLKKVIDETINGKIPNDPSKQLQALNKAVGVLSSSMTQMIKALPENQSSKFATHIDSITQSMHEMVSVCGNAESAVKDLQTATGKQTTFVNTEQMDNLKNLFKMLKQTLGTIREISDIGGFKTTGDTPFKDNERVYQEMIKMYDRLDEAQINYEDSIDGDTAALDKASQAYLQCQINMVKLLNTYTKLGGKETKLDLGEGLKPMPFEDIEGNIKSSFDEVRKYVLKRLNEINTEYQSLGGINLDEYFSKKISQSNQNNALKVPLAISTRPNTLVNQAIQIIQIAQTKMDGNPLEVQVQLVSAWGSRTNQEKLKQIYQQMQTIDNDELKNKMTSLMGDITKQIDKQLMFDVNVKTVNATKAVQEFIHSAKDELALLSAELVPLEPELILTEEHKKAFQQQINEAKGDFKIQIGIQDGDNPIDESKNNTELKFLQYIKNYINKITTAVDKKTEAFMNEEDVVTEVVRNEREVLNGLYGDLLEFEEEVTNIATAFSLLPQKLAVDIDTTSLQKLNELFNNDVLFKISEAKQSIEGTLSQQFGESVVIPDQSKQLILNDVNELKSQLDMLFQTRGIEKWTSTFVNSLSQISYKIQTLFGDNALTNMITGWHNADEIMTANKGADSLRERAGVIDSSNNIHGAYTFDEEGSTRFITSIISELQKQNIAPIVGIHSHGSDRVAASSLPQGKNAVSGDLIAFYTKYLKNGIEKQLTIALNDVELFDAKGFFDSNKGINFKDTTIADKIKQQSSKVKQHINQNLSTYFESFVSQYGTTDGSNITDVLTKHLAGWFPYNRSLVNGMTRQLGAVDPKVILNELFSETNNNIDLTKVIQSLLQKQLQQIDLKSLGYDDNQGKKIQEIINQNSVNDSKEILGKIFGIEKYNFSGIKNRDLWTYAFRQETPQVLSEALKGTGYKNNYQDFMKAFTTEDFIKQNPLGLQSNVLQDLFNQSAPTAFLETLDKIVNDLVQIKDTASTSGLKDMFNVKFDEESLNSFKAEIDKLITALNDLPNILSNIDFSQTTKGTTVASTITVNSLTPVQQLEQSYNAFKQFYNTDDLASEAGANSALAYYNAYKNAIQDKVSKKDLQQFTFDNINDLFTGNYTEYKQGKSELDLSGLDSQIQKYQAIIDKLNQPELVGIINALKEAITQLMNAGNASETTTEFLKSIYKLIESLSGNKSADKIQRIADNLINFKASLQILDKTDMNNGFMQYLSSILEKGEQLKALGEVLKSTDKQITMASKAVNAQENIDKSAKYLAQHQLDILNSINNRFGGADNVLSTTLSASKDGLVQVVALIKDATNAYYKYNFAVKENGELQQKLYKEATLKEVQSVLADKRAKENYVPNVHNLGEEGITFTPDSAKWGELVDKMAEFGLELGNIQKIIRNVDDLGQESFQVFTKLSRITVGMSSNGVLWQTDKVIDKQVLKDFKKEITDMPKLLDQSITGDNNKFNVFIDNLNDIKDKWVEISKLKDTGVVSDEEIATIQKYLMSFKTTLDNNLNTFNLKDKPSEFIQEYAQAYSSLVDIQQIFDKIGNDKPITNGDIALIEQYVAQVRNLYLTTNDKNNNLAKPLSGTKLLGKIYESLYKNSAMSSQLKSNFLELEKQIKSFGNNIPKDKLEEFTTQFFKLDTAVKQTGQTGLSFIDSIMRRARGMSASFIAQFFSFYDIIRYIRQGISTVTELNTGLTEMRKVSDENIDTLREYQKETFGIAKTIGSTAITVQNSTADFMRLGESIQEASESAKVANILFKVSEFENIDEATQSLISMSAAYKNLSKMDIIDKLNNIGNNYAISTNGLATALQNSASALKTAKNDIDESIALATAANQVVQDPDKVITCLNIW